MSSSELLAPLQGEYRYKGVVYCDNYPLHAVQGVESLEFRDDDVIVATYPKSGTTWMQEIVFLIQNGTNLDLAKARPLNERFPFLEIFRSWHINNDGTYSTFIENLPSVRLMKSHLQRDIFDCTLRNKATKFIIVNRNLKDVLVSYYHFYRMNTNLGSFTGTFADFFQVFQQKRIAHGDWFDWVSSWQRELNNPNVLFTTYESMSRDLPTVVDRVAEFLGKSLSPEDVQKICGHVAFENMKANSQTNAKCPHYRTDVAEFIRKGKVGDWKNYLTPEQEEYTDRRTREEVAPEIWSELV